MTDLTKYAIDKLLQHEGKYSNDQSDRGGETYCGITRKNFPDLKLWELLAQGQPEEVLMLHVYRFYEEWWHSIGAELISDNKLSVEYFIASVNCDKSRAVKMMQRSLNYLNRNQKDYPDVSIDGVFGNKTFEAVSALKKKRGLGVLRKMFNVMLGIHYTNIWDNDISQRGYVGWADRLWCEG